MKDEVEKNQSSFKQIDKWAEKEIREISTFTVTGIT